jgi:hypothetical protein
MVQMLVVNKIIDPSNGQDEHPLDGMDEREGRVPLHFRISNFRSNFVFCGFQISNFEFLNFGFRISDLQFRISNFEILILI